jgi:hypothetical protein
VNRDDLLTKLKEYVGLGVGVLILIGIPSAMILRAAYTLYTAGISWKVAGHALEAIFVIFMIWLFAWYMVAFPRAT